MTIIEILALAIVIISGLEVLVQTALIALRWRNARWLRRNQ